MRLIDADALLEILEDKTHKLYEFEQRVAKRTGSRSQEDINAYRELCDWVVFESIVENQPIVEERPTGEWIVEEHYAPATQTIVPTVIENEYNTCLSPTAVVIKHTYICPYCNTKYTSQANFCQNCGAAMKGEVSYE